MHRVAVEAVDIPDLQRPCATCGGDGSLMIDQQVRVKCQECGGQGFFPTPFGEDVLDLVRRNFWKIRRDLD